MTTKLLIARHGNTFNPEDKVRRVGTTDLPLVESGLLQGRKLGLFLQNNNLIPDLIVTSKLQRTQQTAQEAQKTMHTTIPVKSLSIFNEINYGPDENQFEERVVARLGSQALSDWESKAVVPQGWEVDPNQLIKDWQVFAENLHQEQAGKTCLVVTSNGIARFAPYLTGNFAHFCTEHGIKIATGALCLFEYSSEQGIWNCLKWNVKP